MPVSSFSSLEIPALVHARRVIYQVEKWCESAYSIESSDIAETRRLLKLAEYSVNQYQLYGISDSDTQCARAKTVLQICRLRAARHDFYRNKDENLYANKLASIVLSFDDEVNSSALRTQIENEIIPAYAYTKYLQSLSSGGVLHFPPDRFYQIAKKVDINDPNLISIEDVNLVKQLSEQNTKLIEAAELLALTPPETVHLKLMIVNLNYLNRLIKSFIHEYSAIQDSTSCASRALVITSPTAVQAVVGASAVSTPSTFSSITTTTSVSLDEDGDIPTKSLVDEAGRFGKTFG